MKKLILLALLMGSNAQANALFEAIRLRSARVALQMLIDGKPTDLVDKKGNTALHLAVMAPKLELVALELINRNPALIHARNAQGETPLHLAIWYGRELLADTLLTCGAEPNAANQDDWTPLHIAAVRNNPFLAELLVAKGALLTRDTNGRLPHQLAISPNLQNYLTPQKS